MNTQDQVKRLQDEARNFLEKPAYNFPSHREFSMTEIEGRSLSRRKKKKIPLRCDFIEIVIIAVVFAGIIYLGTQTYTHIWKPIFGTEKVQAAERPMSDLETYQEWDGQTKEYCKTYLETH